MKGKQALLAVVAATLIATAVSGQQPADARIAFHIDAQPMGKALTDLGEQSGLRVLVRGEDLRPGQRLERSVSGELTVRAALEQVLAESGLSYEFLDEKTVRISVKPTAAADSTEVGIGLRNVRIAQAENSSAGGKEQNGERTADDSKSTQDLEEVVVTSQRKFRPEVSTAASKFELPIIDTPQALTVLSSEFLDIAHLNDTAAVVAYTPGVELQGMGDGTEAGVSARGFQINRERAFRINGLSTDSEVDLDYFAMDRVEIVRGPASSLYGEADYGATFNRVLKAPDGKSSAHVGAELGSYDFRRLQADVQGPLGANDGVSGRAVVAVQDSKTFIRDTEDDRVLVAPSLAIHLDNTRILLQGYYQKLDGAASDGFPLLFDGTRYSLPRLSRHNNYALDLNKTDSENRFAFAQVDHQLSDTLKLTLKGGYSRIDLQNLSGYLYAADVDGNSTFYSYPEYKQKEDLSLDTSLEKQFEMGGREQRVLLSADWRQNELFQNMAYSFALGTLNVFDGGPLAGYAPPTPPLPAVVDDEFTSSKTRYSGVTALAHLKPAERISLLLGLRYSAINTSINNYAPNFWPGVSRIRGLKDHDVVPRAAVVYQIAPGHNAYLSYSEGIIFNQSLLRQNGTPIDPEQGVQYELGLKGELFDRRVMYSVAAFQITRTDVPGYVFEGPGLPGYYYNVGKQVHRGGEFEVIGEPIPGLNIVASYSNLDVNIRESVNPQEVGHRPIAAPAHSYSLFTTYEILSGPLRSLTFGGGIVGRSSREVDSIGTYQLPRYTRVDARASYDVNKALRVEMNVQNAFNERIYTSVYSSPDLGIAYAYPRTVVGQISYRW